MVALIFSRHSCEPVALEAVELPARDAAGISKLAIATMPCLGTAAAAPAVDHCKQAEAKMQVWQDRLAVQFDMIRKFSRLDPFSGVSWEDRLFPPFQKFFWGLKMASLAVLLNSREQDLRSHAMRPLLPAGRGI